MPERVDDLLIALLADRPLCWDCLADRSGLTIEGARAAVDHLDQRIPVRRRHADRCEACGHVGDTISVDRPSSWHGRA